MLEEAQKAYLAAAETQNLTGMAQARIQAGHAQIYLGDYQAAKLHLTEARQLAKRAGAPAVKAHALSGLGAVCSLLGQYGEAIRYQLDSLRLVQQAGDRLGKARALNTIGRFHVDLRDYSQALRYHTDAYEVATEVGEEPLVLGIAINIAIVHHHSGDYEAALKLNLASLEKTVGKAYSIHEALLLGNIASNLIHLRRYAEALPYCQAALDKAKQANLREVVCAAMVTQATALGHTGQVSQAIDELCSALFLAAEIPSPQREAEAYCELAHLLDLIGDSKTAFEALQRFHELEVAELTAISQERTQVLAAQMQLDLLEHRAAEQQSRYEELAAINANLHAMQKELSYRASHDALTGLFNRPALERMLEAVCAANPPQPGALMFIDLDHFKQINDTLGHPAGDALLQQVARRLRESLEPCDKVARQGGDEFTVLLHGVSNEVEAEERAKQLMERLSSPYVAGGLTLYTTASIGIALFPQHGRDVTTLQKHADLALYQAKHERGRYAIYQASLATEALEQLNVEQALHKALKSGDFYLHYQPVTNAESGEPFMVEALLRWRSPWGNVSPEVFIPVAERSDLILHVSDWVIRTALQQLREWRELWPALKMSVNVSARQLTQPDLSWQLEMLLAETDLEPEALVLELTETAVVDRYKLQHLEELQEAGLLIALDDVGTGYASLAGLAQLPIQMLKIDRSLSEQLPPAKPGRSTRPLVHALVTFAQESDLAVVVEGIETPAQLAVLRQWGPLLVQGHLESQPLSPEEMTAYLQHKSKQVRRQ